MLKIVKNRFIIKEYSLIIKFILIKFSLRANIILKLSKIKSQKQIFFKLFQDLYLIKKYINKLKLFKK